MVDITQLYIFAAFSGLLGLCGVAIALKWVVCCAIQKTTYPKCSRRKVTRLFQMIVVVLILSELCAILWSFIEPYYPKLEKVSIASAKLTAPIRVVQISDLHCDPVIRAEKRVIEMVRSLAPDLILFTGDGINSDTGIPIFKSTMRSLADIAPLYGVRGNWEAWWFKHVDTFADTGMTELTGTPIPLSVRNQKICLVGATVSDEQTLSSVIHSLPREIFTIALHHYPASVNVLDGTVDILLTGDTHGGQISIPFLGPLVRIKRWDRLFHTDGLRTTSKGTNLYVNRGVGLEGGRVPRVRFNVPPEVTLIEAGPSK